MTASQGTTDALLKLGDLIQSTIATYVEKKKSPEARGVLVPPKDLFDAQRALLAAAGALTELVSDPRARLLEVGLQYFEARALHIVTDKRIADILAKNGNSGEGIKALSAATGIESAKLSRVMRCLCSIHIFKEVGEDVFANNSISAALANNEPLRANILFPALDVYSASNWLPLYLSDPNKGPSYAANVTPWQGAVGTTQSRWDWLDEKMTYDDYEKSVGSSGYPGAFGDELSSFKANAKEGASVARPEHSIFGLAMVETGEVLGRPHLYDFPWASLGKATIVDVGGGVGSFSLKLSHEFPDLQFVIQDRAAVLKQAETHVWPKNNKAALDAGRVQFMPHDFFQPNPIKNADVYWVRHVLHNWSDDYCVRVLTAIKSAMGPKSRILLCDQVMNTTRGSPNLPGAPEPLPANWGYYTRYSHQRDLAMMSCLNGIERKPIEFVDIVERAGLRVLKMWDCRSQVGLIEVGLSE